MQMRVDIYVGACAIVLKAKDDKYLPVFEANHKQGGGGKGSFYNDRQLK